ncbi:natural product precursor [Parapedobacter luteus]|uniref:Natural product n=1 Tax=Parapedobacter luteus TaxID=623280 RepID=A0A1T4ZXL0_9SPHI|nr:hypothetical protein [Parapedobacter luteus]SKB27432.1 natural product precursor [Parapedobacter luteus]
MKKISFKNLSADEMLSREEMKNISGGYTCQLMSGGTFTCNAPSASDCLDVCYENNWDCFGCFEVIS